VRGKWISWVAAALVLSVVVQLLPGVPDLPVGASPASAQPADPVPPPAAVIPDPYLRVVETAGPTEVPRNITTDTVWGPQGSPYLVGVTDVDPGVTLTLLPGTVVKMQEEANLGVQGQILVLGTPGERVTITSIRDDSVMGDTNQDGDDTSPARGDWIGIGVSGGASAPVSVFDYADIRYGGNDFEGCVTWAAINVITAASRAVVANSRFFEVQTGVRISGSGSSGGYAGVYNSHFVSGRCGISVRNQGRAEIVGNTFDSSFIDLALQAEAIGDLRSWFNTVQGPMEVFNVFGDAPTQDEADFRFNALLGPVNDRPSWLGLHPKTDWAVNWFGHDANQELPTCMDPDLAAEAIPPIETQPSADCPAGQEEVVGYHDTVLPALSGSPQVLPESAREAAAPRFGPVNTYTGALTYQAEDLTIEDAGKQVTATRTYRSDQLAGGDAGAGWTSAFSEELSQTGDLATLRFSDGSALGFVTDPAAGYLPAPGVSADFSTGDEGTSVTTPARTGYHFDPSGELVRMTLGDDGHELTVERAGGQVSRVAGESGRHLAYERAGGRLQAVTDQAGSEVALTYTGDRLTAVQEVDGQTETYAYDAEGRLIRVTTPEGRVKLAVEYRPDGRVAWVEQQGTGRATFGYDDATATRTITLADGTVITQLYDWAGRLVAEHAGRTGVHIVYDGEGRVVSQITGVPDVPMVGYGPSAPATLYDRDGDPIVSVDPTGRYATSTFNEDHQPLVTTGADGSTVTRTYDGDGRLTAVTDPLDNEWSYTYNDRGQILTQTDPLDRVRTLAYDSEGDLTSVTDETGAVTAYGYDIRGRRSSITDPLGSETQLAYAAWGEVRRVTRPRGGVVTVAFDGDRLPVSLTDETGMVTTYSYDTAGLLASVTDRLGNVTSIGYDVLGRAVLVTDARGSTYQRTYSAEGWVTGATNQLGHTTSYEHDPLGRVVREIDPLEQITQTAYDRAGRVTRQWTPDGALWRYGYDQAGRHSSTVTPRNHTWTMAYDLAGRLTTTTDPEGFGTSTAYDEIGREIETTDQAGVVTSYAYDDGLRTTTASDALGTLWVGARDAAGQVVSEEDGAGVATTFAYDDDGNIVGVTDPAGTTEVEYDLAGRVTAETDAPGGVPPPPMTWSAGSRP
jgi:YD repeat-containing protein